MEIISVFDMLKIGIGPSSSHTLGPWKAANKFLTSLKIPLQSITCIRIELFGSLSLTGKGHATDVAIVMGLTGEMPEEIEPKKIPLSLAEIKTTGKLKLNFEKEIPFSFEENIIFHKHFLPFHPNGLRFTASTLGEEISETYYSIGGGFICTENENSVQKHLKTIPYPIQNGLELLSYCKSNVLNVLTCQIK